MAFVMRPGTGLFGQCWQRQMTIQWYWSQRRKAQSHPSSLLAASEIYCSAFQIDDPQTTFDRPVTHCDLLISSFLATWSILIGDALFLKLFLFLMEKGGFLGGTFGINDAGISHLPTPTNHISRSDTVDGKFHSGVEWIHMVGSHYSMHLGSEKNNKTWEKRQDVVSILSCVFIKCVKRSVVERCKCIDVCVCVCLLFLFAGLLVFENGGLFL